EQVMNGTVCKRDEVGAVGGNDMLGPRLTKGKPICAVWTPEAAEVDDGTKDAEGKAELSGREGAKCDRHANKELTVGCT
ncbi:hypothetical protein KI387_021587, partial [Taxus chinensis]